MMLENILSISVAEFPVSLVGFNNIVICGSIPSTHKIIKFPMVTLFIFNRSILKSPHKYISLF